MRSLFVPKAAHFVQAILLLAAALMLPCADAFVRQCSAPSALGRPSARPTIPLLATPASKEKEEQTAKRIDAFCQGTNEFWKKLVILPVREYVEVRPGGTAPKDPIAKLTAPPEVPGIPRPVWLTILGSVPTALGWYGYYKFSVEEELYQHELQTEGRVTGCGGYGTLFPFVYGIIIGFPLSVLHIPGGETILNAAAFWILASQVNLYRRVNELTEEVKDELGLEGDGRMLYEWWALLPPPLDVVVGLRQVHFLSEYWRVKRGEEYQKDVVAETFFPFISRKERFTLKQFFREPSYWFWFTTEWKDFDFEFLKEK